jgi:PBP1b-binding outer membrane lipoprotein LpoB
MKTIIFAGIMSLTICAMTGCTTTTRKYAQGETRQTVAGFSEADIQDTVSRAVQSILSQDRIKLKQGANRAILSVENIVNDTMSRGFDASVLAESIGLSLREGLTSSGKVVVYNKNVAQYAQVQLTPQYILLGRLTERHLRQDNGDIQKEYNLNLTLVEVATGLEFWQKRIHVGKLVDSKNALN